MDTPAATPMAETVDGIVDLLNQGAHLKLDHDWTTYNFPGTVSKELAARIADRQAARHHAINLEQSSIFVDSQPLADGMMAAAKFLRSLAGDQT